MEPSPLEQHKTNILRHLGALPPDTPPLPASFFDVVVLDPPWFYEGVGDKPQAAGKHYDLLHWKQIANLGVPNILADRAVVFLWVTSPKLEHGFNVLKAWGLRYVGIAFNWVKTTQGGKVIQGQGVRPTITKGTTELVLAATNVPSGRPLPVSDESVGQVILDDLDEVVLAPRPGNRHSAKPEEVLSRIDTLYPTARKLEMFRRGPPRPGWEAWGNQAQSSKTLPLSSKSPTVIAACDKQTREAMGAG